MPPRSKKPGFTEAERQAAVARVDRGEDIDWTPPKDNSPAETGCATKSRRWCDYAEHYFYAPVETLDIRFAYDGEGEVALACPRHLKETNP